MSYLILVRHGESRWNLSNKFTGWVDVPLSEIGILEALMTANKLKNLTLDIGFTSKLSRAKETLSLILSEQNKTGIFFHNTGRMKVWSRHKNHNTKEEIPVFHHEALNERYYGRLQGINKDEARKEYGEEQVFTWRRSYDIRPPDGESLKDVYKRSVPYFKKQILPQLSKGKNVIVSAHGNSLRAIIKFLDSIPDDQIPSLELETGKPIIYKYDNGILTRENHVHSFNRPVHWNKIPKHKQDNNYLKNK